MQETTTSNDSDALRFRYQLAPYFNQRVCVRGVLIDIIAPSAKNKNKPGLVFASVRLPNEQIELDHVVIQVDNSFLNRTDIQLFKTYQFTAVVKKYFHNKYDHELKFTIMAENYQLVNINENRLKTYNERNQAFSSYQKQRIEDIAQRQDIPYSKEQAIDVLIELPNNGSREKWLDDIKRTYRKNTLSKRKIQRTLEQAKGGITHG